jgi:uroporphyrin-III C-methyltransferase
VTGADVSGGLPVGLNWAALADPQATTVVYMGKRTFPALAEGLIGHGLPPQTPALLAEAVGHPEQTLTRTTVSALAESLSGDRSTLPALILYGPLAESDP